MQVAYFLPLFASVLTTATAKRWLICATPEQAESKGIVFTRDPAVAAIRALRLLATEKGAQVTVLIEPPAQVVSRRFTHLRFELLRTVFGTGITMVNMFIRTLPRRKIRILASENWHNIQPALAELPDAELVLLDRAQITRISIPELLKHRMQFRHVDEFKIPARNQRDNSKNHPVDSLGELVDLKINERSIHPLCIELLEAYQTFAVPRVISEIDSTYRMIERLAPDVILLRASVSSQPHFAILALVAKNCDVPAIELQHGLEYLGPGSISKEHSAEYIAVYGSRIQDELITLGYAKEKLPIIGSPRFDTYTQNSTKSHEASHTVLVIVPDTITPTLDSYQILDYYNGIAEAVARIPEAHLIFKLRPGPDREAFHRRAIQEACEGASYEIAQYESLQDLCARAGILITCYSTVVLEALMFETLVVLPKFSPNEAIMIENHFGPYQEMGAVRVAHNTDELTKTLTMLLTEPLVREAQLEAGRALLKDNYSFDGRASEHMRDLIISLSQIN